VIIIHFERYRPDSADQLRQDRIVLLEVTDTSLPDPPIRQRIIFIGGTRTRSFSLVSQIDTLELLSRINTITNDHPLALSDSEVNRAIKTRQLRILPKIGKLNPAGIDLQVDRGVLLNPRRQKLVATMERVELSENLMGILHIRSSLAREGILASLALVDPGFKGQLTVSLYNAGDRWVRLRKGERFIQLSLFRLGTPALHTYSGNYQNSRGVVKSRRRKKLDQRKMENVIHTRRG